jgi:uncharacterized membrane protein
MAKDLGDAIGTALGKVAREAVGTVSASARGNGSLSGAKGIAAGIGAVTLAPLAAKGAGKLVKGIGGDGGNPVQKAGEKLGGGVKDAVTGGLPDMPGLPGKGDKSDKSDKSGKSQGVPGVGKGRRMPIQQDIDIGVPLKTVYNQWTQFEEWPNFMHRLDQVSQEDEGHLSFKTKIWGISKEFKAEIVEQRPDERIKWKVTEGVTHEGVVTFHELGPRLTRVELNIDVQPGSLIEKAARGMRHVKRAVRADLARFKAYVLMEEEETGAWRGAIEEGEVKKQERSSSSSGQKQERSSSSSGQKQERSSSSSGRKRSSASSRSRSSASSRSGSSSSKRRGSTSRSKSSGSSNGGSGRTTARRKSGSRS